MHRTGPRYHVYGGGRVAALAQEQANGTAVFGLLLPFDCNPTSVLDLATGNKIVHVADAGN